MSKFRLLLARERTSAPTPSNTVAPALTGTAVVGETLACTTGTWTNSPTSYAYQWKRGSTNVGTNSATYVLVEADAAAATRGAITCVVTATNADGSTQQASNATAVPRRTYPTVTVNIGALTDAGDSSVILTNAELGLKGVGATSPTSWTTGTATSGTDAHWTKLSGRTPTPSAAGDTADLNAGPYVFPLTATWSDGLTESNTLTINIDANTVTIADEEWYFPWAVTALGGAAAAAGKTFTIATGSHWENAVAYQDSYPLYFDSNRFSSPITVKYADVNRPSVLPYVRIGGSQNIIFEDIQTCAANYWQWDVGAASGNRAEDIVINRARNTNTTFTLQVWAAHRGAKNITWNDCHTRWVSSMGADYTDAESAENIVWNNCTARYFSADAWTFSGSVGPHTFNDCFAIAPRRYPTDTIHFDGWQGLNGQNDDQVITLNRCGAIQADGDAAWQGYFQGGTGKPKTVINGFIYTGWGNNAVYISKGNHNRVYGLTIWKVSGPQPYNTSSTENDNPAGTSAWLRYEGAADNFQNTDNLIDHVIAYSNTSVGTGGNTYNSLGSNVVTFGATDGNPTTTGYFASAPKSALEALSYGSMTPQQIVTATKAILADATGTGALDASGDWIDRI